MLLIRKRTFGKREDFSELFLSYIYSLFPHFYSWGHGTLSVRAREGTSMISCQNRSFHNARAKRVHSTTKMPKAAGYCPTLRRKLHCYLAKKEQLSTFMAKESTSLVPAKSLYFFSLITCENKSTTLV